MSNFSNKFEIFWTILNESQYELTEMKDLFREALEQSGLNQI